MTAPASNWRDVGPAAHVPTYRIESLELPGLGRIDDLGRAWELTGEKGWNTAAAPRSAREDRPSGHGSFRSVAWRGDKTMSITGTVHFDDPALREQTQLELAGLCADPARLYTLRRTTATTDHIRHVELDGDQDVELVGGYDIDFQLTFAAPDPRKHDRAWQEPITTIPTAATGGLDFDGGLDFSGGADFGDSAVPQVARVLNRGSAYAHPVFALVGPLNAPVIRQVETGVELAYRGDIAAGETVWINCDAFSARGVPGHGRLSTLRGNVGSLVPVTVKWPRVEPSSESRFVLQANGGAGAGMRTHLRQAWW